MKSLFLFLPALTTVGVFGDQCIVTHQGKETMYKTLNPSSNAECDYSWATSDGTVLANHNQPNNGSVSSSHSSLTLPKCRENVSVKIDCHPKDPLLTFCPTNCTAAQEPQAYIDPTSSSPVGFWTTVETPVETPVGPPVGIVVVIAAVIAAVIAVGIAAVIAVVCCRKKENSCLEQFKRVCRFNKPPGEEGSRREEAGMLEATSSV